MIEISYFIIFITFGLVLYGLSILYYRYRSVPPGVNPPERVFRVPSDRIRFLYDLVWLEKGENKAERFIFKAIRRNIRNAQNRILFDVFLFNQLSVDYKKNMSVTEMIIDDFQKSKKSVPKYFITDPLNIGYGTAHCPALANLQKTGTKIIFTDLDRLPDNNLIYSGFWRLFLQWFGTRGKSYWPYPSEPKKKTTLRAFLKAMNGKANHRKLILCDDKVILTSSNLHDSSSNYGNTGIEIQDRAVADYCLASEKAVARMSGSQIDLESQWKEKKGTGDAQVMPLMGRSIRHRILDDIEKTVKGDKIIIGMLFIAHRKSIKDVKKAADRGVKITIILDNNLRSFDQKKFGFPNAYLIPELMKKGVEGRWFNSVENEYHTKFVYIKKPKTAILHVGSANLTRRSLMGANLENNVRVAVGLEASLVGEVDAYVAKILTDQFSEPIDHSPRMYGFGYLWCRFAEWVGLATW